MGASMTSSPRKTKTIAGPLSLLFSLGGGVVRQTKRASNDRVGRLPPILFLCMLAAGGAPASNTAEVDVWGRR